MPRTRMMPTMEERIVGSSLEPRRDHDFDALFRGESPGVYRTLYAYTGGRADVAEEAVAEAFARALAHASTIRDPLPWIYRTAFRLANEELRRGSRQGDSAAIDAEIPPPELQGVIEAIRHLSANQRAAIVLRHVLDLDMGEVASRMGIATPTVRVHLHRGRKQLRRLLGDEEAD
jgi:RNA polymerase sigma-70 factor, ECF subfamily